MCFFDSLQLDRRLFLSPEKGERRKIGEGDVIFIVLFCPLPSSEKNGKMELAILSQRRMFRVELGRDYTRFLIGRREERIG